VAANPRRLSAGLPGGSGGSSANGAIRRNGWHLSLAAISGGWRHQLAAISNGWLAYQLAILFCGVMAANVSVINAMCHYGLWRLSAAGGGW